MWRTWLAVLLSWSGVIAAPALANNEGMTSEEFVEEDLVGRFWELDEDQKRGVFQLRTYHPNFVLPIHHSSDINTTPESPTRGPSDPLDSYKPNEVKLQISLRTKLFEDLVLPNADVWVSYTQVSLWQAWNSDDSSPFRSTNYNPDIFYVIPWADDWDFIPGDARVRFAKVGFAHESNGQRKPDSRSWNYVHFGGAVEWGDLLWETRWKQRVNEVGDEDDNPDLIRFRGNFENRFSWRNDLSTYSLTRTTREFSWDRGSWQLDFTHPVNSDKPDGLRFYIQFFSGYGETLIDYNHRQNRIGIGFLLLNI
ncbi:Putative phospholipase A1 [Pseudidiomarina piscicola]|uniref:Phospholipase A1 n=1 Tax=Pseudidiomarina piscicola TaxID=2614830 RepID=A0A6S6WLQ1_9GAMM|nr:phospholipase A [Pseudidiomarina piscicola]CAB0150908.1 Putative phospholipase A1 [Pseudidiomarina piscicola]VZT40414.1 Putative phospholipase A1 [Pseudomonas aeruginosa]